MGIVCLVLLLVAICSGFGEVLNEIWIETNNTGNIDSRNNDTVYMYYTGLSAYQLNPAQNNYLRFRLRACHDSFLLLSAVYDLNSTEFYEIVIGGASNSKTFLRRINNEYVSVNSIAILSCKHFNNFTISWSLGQITLIKTLSAPQVIINWTDASPIVINGIGIRNGFGTNGTWIIEHEATVTGNNCGRSSTYGDMHLLKLTKTRSAIECNVLCLPNNHCLGVNFNIVSNECQLIAGGQVVKKLPLDVYPLHKCDVDNRPRCFHQILYPDEYCKLRNNE